METPEETITSIIQKEIVRLDKEIKVKIIELAKFKNLLNAVHSEKSSLPDITIVPPGVVSQSIKELFDDDPKLEISAAEATKVVAEKLDIANHNSIKRNIYSILNNYASAERNILKSRRLKPNEAPVYSLKNGWKQRGQRGKNKKAGKSGLK